MAKIAVGMSGGVDSAVTAYLLKEAGHEVVGVTLRLLPGEENASGKCCEIDDARSTAAYLGCEYYVVRGGNEFERFVTKPFIKSYLSGCTPNPCIECNRFVKWSKMMEFASHIGADYVATGHYARIVQLPNGRFSVRKADYDSKDQTYMLWKLTQKQLASTIMPLGGLSKDSVREIARRAGLPVASKPDSQDICFVPDNDYAGYILDHAGEEVPPEGNFVDEDGNILGSHRGIIHYTIGQRKGLGIALGSRTFVKEIRPETNEVVLGTNESLFTDTVVLTDVNFMSIEGLREGERYECLAKVRYHHKAEAACAESLGDGRVKLTFERPVRAVTPGQSAVFYDADDCIAGGGIIIK